ncbi:MAG: TonB-dependent receptor plug domain-containing protein [Gemmatimonadaceae bacterium]|nr:TonB-dependent receptor plug domain-containing protein [Gemmatimonadaceae bacterium]
MQLTDRPVRRLAAVLGALVATATTALAQPAVITGKVTSAQGAPLEAANAFITELALSVGTNAAGQYTITIPAERVRGQTVVLRIRAIGYVPQTRAVTLRAGTQTFDFEVQRDVNRLTDIVVTGVTAGTEQRKVPFVVSQVSEKDMPVVGANPLTQLQGKVPGANILGTSGRPGAQPAVLLRGPTAINASGRGQQPLYVVDGVILAGAENGAGLPDLNPQDIESVEVVKGAAAASLYGARAGNGVIQITTKSGKNQRDGLRWTINTEFGSSDIEREFQLARNTFLAQDETANFFCSVAGAAGQCQQRLDIYREALRINQGGSLTALPPAQLLNDGGIAAAPSNANLAGLFQVNSWPTRFNPVAAAVTPSALLNTNIDVQGRTGKTNFFGSVSYFDQQGALRYLQGFDRWSGRLNLDQGFGDKFNLSVRTFYSRNQQDGLNQSGGEQDGANATGFFALTRTPAYVDLLRTDNLGRLFVRSNITNQGGGNGNPLYSFQNSRRTDGNDRFLGAATLRFTPTTWFDLEGNASIDRTNGNWWFQQDRGFRTILNEGPANLGTITRLGFTNQSVNTYLNATARKDWSEDLKTRLTARYLYEQQDFANNRGDGDALVVPGLTTLNAATQNFAVRSQDQSIRQISLFSELSAEYKDRYFFSGLIRRDGSSLFGAANRWANFGRAALGWDMARESWFFVRWPSELRGAVRDVHYQCRRRAGAQLPRQPEPAPRDHWRAGDGS